MVNFPSSLVASILYHLSLALLVDYNESYAFLAFTLDQGICNRPSHIAHTFPVRFFNGPGNAFEWARKVMKENSKRREPKTHQKKNNYLIWRDIADKYFYLSQEPNQKLMKRKSKSNLKRHHFLNLLQFESDCRPYCSYRYRIRWQLFPAITLMGGHHWCTGRIIQQEHFVILGMSCFFFWGFRRDL